MVVVIPLPTLFGISVHLLLEVLVKATRSHGGECGTFLYGTRSHHFFLKELPRKWQGVIQ